MKTDWEIAVEDLAERDGRYNKEAFFFIYRALDFTVKKMGLTEVEREKRHVTGRDLLMGISEYAFDQFGPLTREVLSHWRVHQTRDFGEIVFALVEGDLMGKTEHDSIEDFIDVYNFGEEFDWKKRRAAQQSAKKS
tara:strand:- start:1870 stop:2277 length:408 start_codon:yes stop_codon:yes gene_type:complete